MRVSPFGVMAGPALGTAVRRRSFDTGLTPPQGFCGDTIGAKNTFSHAFRLPSALARPNLRHHPDATRVVMAVRI